MKCLQTNKLKKYKLYDLVVAMKLKTDFCYGFNRECSNYCQNVPFQKNWHVIIVHNHMLSVTCLNMNETCYHQIRVLSICIIPFTLCSAMVKGDNKYRSRNQ